MSTVKPNENVDAINVAQEESPPKNTVESEKKCSHPVGVSGRGGGGAAKVCSVSFKDDGFIWRERSSQKQQQERKEIGSTSDRSVSHSIDVPDQEDGDDENKPLINTRSRHLSRSLDAMKNGQANYNSIGQSLTSTPIVFCVHGNKFGVARCCDDLVPGEHTTGKSGAGSADDMENHMGILGTPGTLTQGSSSADLHCHSERNGEGIDKTARKKLIIASVLCLFFMVVEIVGGVLANSLAIATDAAHLLTDFASFLISLFSIWVASRPATRRMSFGWHRAEVIGATVSVLLIWVVTGVLVYAAIQRINTMDFELDPTIMLITSGIGVLVNIIMGCTLHQHGGHSHGGGGHGHSHGGEASTAEHGGGEAMSEEQRRKENINVRAAFIHVLGDFIQSMGVFIAALVIYFYPAYIIIDPICTFIFSVLVLVTTIRILRDTMNVLMEGIPRDVSFNVVQETFQSVEGIVAVHNLRIWGLTTDKTALSAHLVVAPGSNPQTILRDASTKIRAKYNFYEMTLQVEEFQQDMDDCTQCQPPDV